MLPGFEWDEDKRAANLAKHRRDFEEVVALFGLRFWERRSQYADEERWLDTGDIDDDRVTIIFTWRDGRRRIISARAARTGEYNGYRHLYP